MKTKNIITILAVLPMMAYMTACKSDDVTEAKPGLELLNVEKEVAFAAQETSWTVKIVADCYWEVTSVDNPGWDDLTVSPRSGEGNSTLVLTTEQNHRSVERTAVVTLTTKGGLQQRIIIHQTRSGADLSINEEVFEFDDNAGQKSLIISCNTNWEILGLSSTDWLKLEQTSGGAGVIEIPIIVNENYDDTNRAVTLTVSAGSIGDNCIDFMVTQTGKTNITLSVSNELLPIFPAEGGVQTVQVNSNAGWRAFVPSTAQDWVHIEPAFGFGNGEIQVRCDGYGVTTRDRMTVVIVTAGSLNPQQSDIFVQQSAAVQGGPQDGDNPNPQLTR